MQHSNGSDISYWRQREAEERAQADDETCRARPIHAELADRYALLIAEADDHRRHPSAGDGEKR